MLQQLPLRSSKSAPVVQPLLPVAAAPASPGPRPALHQQLLRRRVRRTMLLGLAAFLLVNCILASRALYRAWQGRGSEREQLEERPTEVRRQVVSAADNVVAATMDSAEALKSAAKHTATVAGQAAGAAIGATVPLAAKAASTLGTAAKDAVRMAAGVINGSVAVNKTTPKVTAANVAASTPAANGATTSGPQAKRQARELPAPPTTADASNDSCAQALGIPKVALLFLTYGPLYHEAAWRLWFASAAGLLPAREAESAVCEPGAEVYEAMRGACSSATSVGAVAGMGPQPIERQHLYSVHIHAPPSFEGYPSGSLWEGCLIPRRVPTGWGNFSLIEATRSLLWEAFKDPLNQRFVLLSESDIPLYDPLTLHQQLLAEDKSRTEHMNASHWRKSGQFIGLTRAHVEAVLRDVEVYRSFEQHCIYEWDDTRKAFRDCFAGVSMSSSPASSTSRQDEHYFPTLLAALGRENETECGGWGVATQDWSKGGAHPKAYRHGPAAQALRLLARPQAPVSHDPLAAEVRPALVRRVREPSQCDSNAAFTDAQLMYVDAGAALAADRHATCQQLHAAVAEASYSHALPGSCPLTARKFPPETAAAVEQLFSASCSASSSGGQQQKGGGDGALHLLGKAYCRAAAPKE
ncbi:hypothetical protein CHLNCDRAFT_55340 [Chlorella variabilis]|uniref:Uncharacterized protein n=1 Tax=Chlorella variabilis TaxID=554065 RepID=E1ZST3_CHLVA|nr:hypothetical protein CHLNCDRAFT_55340 [Chlorella variabilis]EFN51093.1 hypothetical protein CHLNCDRAFT_55340 [Chlorella variabilis]|eukprot:XP_005843195.1 hypothetical protein CHLNCDRAFT_55340 [Chlorella variabilis]